jgi:hypothetical protein
MNLFQSLKRFSLNGYESIDKLSTCVDREVQLVWTKLYWEKSRIILCIYFPIICTEDLCFFCFPNLAAVARLVHDASPQLRIVLFSITDVRCYFKISPGLLFSIFKHASPLGYLVSVPYLNLLASNTISGNLQHHKRGHLSIDDSLGNYWHFLGKNWQWFGSITPPLISSHCNFLLSTEIDWTWPIFFLV